MKRDEIPSPTNVCVSVNVCKETNLRWCLVVFAFELMLIVDIGHIRYDEEIYPESDVRLGFGYLIALCSPAISVPKFQVLLTGTRVHSVIFVISLKLNISPLSASILTFFAQNHLILTYFIHFDTSHCFYKYYSVSKCVICIKCRWFCIEKVRIEAQKGKIYNFNEITKITECTRLPVVLLCIVDISHLRHHTFLFE